MVLTDEPYAPEGLTDWRTTTVLAALRSLPVYVDGWDEAVDPADDTKFELVPWEECQVMRGKLPVSFSSLPCLVFGISLAPLRPELCFIFKESRRTSILIAFSNRLTTSASRPA